ncbi:hypothetical protein [Martelella radicis]|uniref:Flagellin-like hook-associated protein FlgL n=1 Tax=Martelella radicis TaxID=1397476 RepID=A0A7W6PBR3_9HYPH|nr:hypothetical protein [Martelella radicis]MBB4122919.1 flagellin-like hook-associated protein FlgL [Martelella radicis]
MASKITIICRNPGMRRAGIKHPASATYPATKFSKTELDAFRADPAFEVIDGEAPAATTMVALAAAKDEAKANADALEKAKGELKDSNASLEAARNELKEALADNDTLRTDLAARQTEIEGLKKQVADLEAANQAQKETAEKAAKTTPKK